MSTKTRNKSIKLHPLSVKAVDIKERTFEGLAATWDLDLGGDIIHRGAFKDTLLWWKANGSAIPLVNNHRYHGIEDVLGSVVDAEETDAGLLAKFEVDEGERGDLLFRHIAKNRLNGLSIGYEAENPERDSEGVRHLKKIKLFEVSAVIWPMQPGARFDPSSVKSAEEFEEAKRVFLQGLDSGLCLTSKEQADLRDRLADGEAKADPVPDEPEGIAPDDPKRLAAEAILRDLTIRSLAA
jgi:HK97 family phage prohead protease